jgi:CRISP-associated protein Cas1
MGTVYLTQEDAFIGKIDERLNVKADKQQLLDMPFIKVDGIVVLGRATFSPAVISELLERHIPLSFLTKNGKYLGHLEPELTKNIFVRKAQWAASGESTKSIHIVQQIVRGKLKNYRTGLMRRRRDYSDFSLDKDIEKIEQIMESINNTYNINSLRGLEGAGSAAYFGAFNKLIKGSEFQFNSRIRRPPTDPINSLLSLGYALLRHDIQSAVNIVGFDPYLGYLHFNHYGRPSLALDMMEEFRPLVVDAVVLSAINQKRLTVNDFVTEPISNAVSLTKDALKIFLRLYEEKKQSKFKHPVLLKQCTYQEAFEIQSRLLSKYLMEQIDKYPPLILK